MRKVITRTLGIIILTLVLSCEKWDGCWRCQVVTSYDGYETMDTTIIFCDRSEEWAREFSRHNTYVSEGVYQVTNCFKNQ